MAIKIKENPKQRTEAHYKRPTVTRVFKAWGSRDRTEVLLAIAQNTPAFDQGIDLKTGTAIFVFRNKVSLDEIGGGSWEATVLYESSSDSIELSFSFGVQSTKIFTSLETMKVWSTRIAYSGAANDAAGDWPNNKKAIGLNGDDVDGTEIETGKVEFSITKKWKRALLPATYFMTLAEFTDRSCVNHAPYTILWMGQTLTFSTGTLRFRSATVKQNSDEELDLSYHFHYQRSITVADAWTIGASDFITKGGHEVAWIRYETVTSEGVSVKNPTAVYIEKVYHNKNFVDLAI